MTTITLNSNWTKEDKFKLYESLKIYKSNEIQQIAKYIGKSQEEVEEAIHCYLRNINASLKERQKSPKSSKSHKAKATSTHTTPLYSWSKFITDQISTENLSVQTASALQLLAEFEHIPDPTFTANFNFSEVYFTLANALEGKPIKCSDKTEHLLRQCLLDTALYSKAFKRNPAVASKLESIALMLKNKPNLPFVDDAEIHYVNQLLRQQAYNPLDLELNCLKPNLDIL